jgi:hypothetical protein
MSVKAMDLIALLAVVVAGAVAALIVWWFRGSKAAEAPACGRCGYCVRGITTLVCPECGADLREVGIVGPGMRKAPRPGVYILIWTLLLPVPAVILSAVGLAVAPRYDTVRMERVILCQSEPLRATIRVVIRGRTLCWPRFKPSPRVPMQTMDLLLDQPPAAPLHVDLVGLTHRYTDVAGRVVKNPVGLSQEGLTGWLTAAGLKVNDDRTQEYIRKLLQTIRNTPQAQNVTDKMWVDSNSVLPEIEAGPTSVCRERLLPWWVSVSIWLFWILVWLAGTRQILRWRRATMDAVGASE